MSDHLWTIEDALSLSRELEATAAVNGFHVGITGSVLRDGFSDKDLDIVVFPHNTTDAPSQDKVHAMFYAHHRIVNWTLRPHGDYGDGKEVWTAIRDGKRIDFFFLK